MTSYALLDHAASARSHSSTASAATRRAERNALEADEYYRLAARSLGRAVWLTARPDLWSIQYSYTPAHLESDARNWEKLGDLYLRSSFRATDSAEFYRDLAAKYRAMRDRSKESI